MDEWVYGWSRSLFLVCLQKTSDAFVPTRRAMGSERALSTESSPSLYPCFVMNVQENSHSKHLSALIFTFYSVHICMCVFSWNRYVISVPERSKCACFCECVVGNIYNLHFKWPLLMTQDFCVKAGVCVCVCVCVCAHAYMFEKETVAFAADCCVWSCGPAMCLWFGDLCFELTVKEFWMCHSFWGDLMQFTGCFIAKN